MWRDKNLSGSSFPVPSYSLGVGSGNENRYGTPHVINFQRFSEGGRLVGRGGGIKERNVRNKGQGGRGWVYKRAGLKKLEALDGFTKEGSSLERTKVVKVLTLTFTSVHVGIEVQRKI